MRKLLIISMLLLFCFAAAGLAQAPYRVVLSSEKRSFLLGEPVVINVQMTNTGRKPIRVANDLGPELDDFHYYIVDPAGKSRPFSPLYVIDTADFTTVNINSSIYGTANLFYGALGYSFPKPGTYKVHAKFRGATSNMLAIEIRQPRNDQEKEQAALILEHNEVGFYIMIGGGDELIDALMHINVLIEKYPQSPLTAYAKWAMAENYSRPARNFVTKKPRKANFQKAIEILESIKDEKIQFYYRIKIFNTLSRSLKETDQNTKAGQVRQELQKVIRDNENLELFNKKMIDTMK